MRELTGISESEAIQQQARALGHDPGFEPDSLAEAEYRYRTKWRVAIPGAAFTGKEIFTATVDARRLGSSPESREENAL